MDMWKRCVLGAWLRDQREISMGTEVQLPHGCGHAAGERLESSDEWELIFAYSHQEMFTCPLQWEPGFMLHQ